MSDTKARAALLAAHEDLPRKLETILRETLKENLLRAPSVVVESAEKGMTRRDQGRASIVLIRRSDPKEMKASRRDAGAPLVVWVNSLAVAPEHVRLTLKGEKWLLENQGDYPVEPVGTEHQAIVPGAAQEFPGNTFSFKIRNWTFDFKSETATSEEVGGVQFDEGAIAREEDFAEAHFRVLGCGFVLKSPADFWAGREDRRNNVLQTIWARFAVECRMENPGAVEYGDTSPRYGSGASDAFAIAIAVSGAGKKFTLEVPVSFYRAVLDRTAQRGLSPHWEKIEGKIRWRRLVFAGERTLRLRQLQSLGPGTVVVLKSDSASMADPDLDLEWKLTRLDSGPLFRDHVPFRIGERKRQVMQSGGFENPAATALEVDDIPVRLQAVFVLGEMSVEDLRKLGPAGTLPLNLSENSDVGIAINGRIMGQGKLVRVPSDRFGVQITGWYE